MTWQKLLPYGVIAALLVALVLTCGDEAPEPILSEETRAEIDRLRAENVVYRGLMDSLEAASEAEDSISRGRSDSLKQLSRASHDASVLREERASDIHKSANQHAEAADRARASVVTAPTARDSFNFMRIAYDERTHEAATVRRSYDTLGSSLLLERNATQREKERADEAEASKKRAVDIEKDKTRLAEERVRDLEALNARILDDVAEAEKGCRILGIVRCPTRKESFVVGAVLGAGAAVGATLAMK